MKLPNVPAGALNPTRRDDTARKGPPLWALRSVRCPAGQGYGSGLAQAGCLKGGIVYCLGLWGFEVWFAGSLGGASLSRSLGFDVF